MMPPPTESSLASEKISALPGRTYLLGRNISHSLSPGFHNRIYASLGLPWKFDQLDTANAADLEPLMREPAFIGASVTMPHKVAVMKHLDNLTEAAKLTQAVNSIFVQKDQETCQRVITGTNTDCIGIRDALNAAHPETAKMARGRPGMVIGGGGACRAAVYALRAFLGCSEIYLVNRDAKELEQVVSSFENAVFDARCICVSTADDFKKLKSPIVIVGTIPDFPPQSDEERRARAVITTVLDGSPKGVLLDMCYYPSAETQLMSLARQKGWKVVSGIEIFFYQAIAMNSLWTGVDAAKLPLQEAREFVFSQHE